MRRAVAVAAFLTASTAFGACGDNGGSSVKSAGGTTTVSSDAPPVTNAQGKPHFDTPEAAMRYLAAAWNADDLVKLKHVTDPSARGELATMHGVAVNLRLNHCDEDKDAGDYTCFFDHDFPSHASTTMAITHTGQTGEAVFLVGPADTPGWYMTVFESCS